MYARKTVQKAVSRSENGYEVFATLMKMVIPEHGFSYKCQTDTNTSHNDGLGPGVISCYLHLFTR